MHVGPLTTSLIIAIAVGGCGSSTQGVADASTDAAPFCSQARSLDCSASSEPLADFCSLNMGMESACGLCPPSSGAQGCSQAVLVHGTKYAYLELVDIDTATIYVYDANGALVAQVGWSPVGFKCRAGPADFDPNEAESLLPVVLSATANAMCPLDGGSAS